MDPNDSKPELSVTLIKLQIITIVGQIKYVVLSICNSESSRIHVLAAQQKWSQSGGEENIHLAAHSVE
jgi:hypothetical protein